MGFQVVCISRTLAAGGEIVGQAVAQHLGFHYMDREIIGRAAERAKVDPSVVAAAEQRQPLIRRLIEAIGVAQVLADPAGFSSGVPTESYYTPGLTPLPALPEDYRALIRETIQEIASRGQAVIVAHAASMALLGRRDVLRVFITASAETRARRLVAAGHVPTETEAAAIVAQADRERREYIRSFYKRKEELPTDYDLIVNTDVLTFEQAAHLVLNAVED
ncbi:MAG: cytidylate kinase-like family protein [Deltaproteobacteria bacterium]|nr:cytidylate kinase-like family protein [Deltaproteobacteria bacterium]